MTGGINDRRQARGRDRAWRARQGVAGQRAVERGLYPDRVRLHRGLAPYLRPRHRCARAAVARGAGARPGQGPSRDRCQRRQARPSRARSARELGPRTPALGDVARARDAVAEDIAHVLRSGGMSEDDIRAWKEALDASSSADQLKTVLGRGIELVNARLADLQARYRRGAKPPPELLSPKSRATLDKLRQWSAPVAASR